MKSGWIIVWLLSARQVPLFKCVHPWPVITTLRTQLRRAAWEGDPRSVAQRAETHDRPFKIQLNFDFRSLSQTHSVHHRRSATLWSVLVRLWRLWKHLSSNARLISPLIPPWRAAAEPLRPKRSTGSLGHPGRETQKKSRKRVLKRNKALKASTHWDGDAHSREL